MAPYWNYFFLQAMLPSLPQYMIALLKILLAAAPTSKAKTDSINIMTDVLPEEMPMTVMQSMKLGRMGFSDVQSRSSFML